MAAELQPLEELAEAVLLGSPVDWESAESSAGSDREAVRQLRVLAGIAELHRNLTYVIPESARPGAPDETLQRWGRLEICERIGRGSFGEVYRAWDSKLDREVAVKLLHAGGAGTEDSEVLREARLLARVRHPNVVTVYDADEIEGRVGLWMEFIRGHDLEQLLKEKKKFDEQEVTRIGIDLCRALSAVHEAGLLHRDIKTQNLMQAGDGRLVLMDFGTGRELERDPTSRVDAAGTPLYLAPEVFTGAPATVRSDIYSAGVLLFHLLTGAYPVRGRTVKEVGEAHARGQRVELVPRSAGEAKSLAAVIGRALHPDPGLRFASAREMLAALEKLQRRSEAQKRKRYWMAFGAVSVVAIALAAVAGMRRPETDQSGRQRGAGAPYVGLTPEKREVQTPPAMFVGTPSPDGRYLPYSVRETGNIALYEFATGESRVLTTTGDASNYFGNGSIVSVDGKRVAYNWIDGSADRIQLRVIDADGTNERTLSTDPNPTSFMPGEWSPDGRHILAARQRPGGETELVLVSAMEGSLTTIRTFVHGPGHATLSPDGRYIAYDRAEDSEDRDRGIYLSRTDGGQEIPVVTGSTYDSHPMWTPDGSGLVFASMRTGGPGLWLQAVKDGQADGRAHLLDKNMGPFAPITLTRAGSFFYRHRTGLMDVYTVPIDPVTGDVTGEPTNGATSVLGSNIAPSWSPDGGTLVFASWRTLFGPGQNILVFHSMETGRERELEVDVQRVNGPHWSPDGRLIAIGGSGRDGLIGTRLIDAETGNIVSNLFVQAGDMPPVGPFDWAPDGRHAYFKRNNARAISRMNVVTGEEEVVYEPPPDSGTGRVCVSPDGRWLATVLRRKESVRLIAIPTAGGAVRDIGDIEPGQVGAAGWTRDGKHVFLHRMKRVGEKQENHGELWIMPFDGGPARNLGLSMPSLRDVRVSPAGDRIAFTSGYPDQGMWVLENSLPKAAVTAAPNR